MANKNSINPEINSEIEIFQTRDGQASFEVNIFEETVWLNQKQMAELFDKDRKTITEHIGNIFKEGELEQSSTCRKFQLVQIEGNRKILRDVEYYNLDVIISVGYRVKSKRGIQFRQWATRVLKQYLLNGYAVNESRVKKIEESLDELVSSHKLLKDDVDGIKNLLLKLIEKPIIIHNHNHNSNNNSNYSNNYNHINHDQTPVNKELESLIELLDEVAKSIKDKKAQDQITTAKLDIANSSTNPSSKKRLFKFLKDLGDEKSDIHKVIKGAEVAKDLLSKLIKLSGKVKDLIGF